MLANRVREYTLTTGAGDITLSGAMAAHIRFSDAFAAGETMIYVIEDGDNYEIGTGTLLDAATLQRTTVSETLADGVYDRDAPDAITLSGSARVYCAATAGFLLDPTEAADVIREVTPDAGVTVDGVLLKDGGGSFSDTVTFQKVAADAFGVRGVSDADSPVFASGTSTYGANIQMHGPSASAAGDMSFRTGSTPWMYWDSSLNLMSLTGNLTSTANLKAAGNLIVDRLATANNPTVFFRHDNFASDTRNYIDVQRTNENMRFGVAGSVPLTLSETSATFSGNIVAADDVSVTGGIRRESSAGVLPIAGGQNSGDGGNILLYGNTHPTAAGDIWFRSGSVNHLVWDSSTDLWNFQGNDVYGVRTLTMSGDAIHRHIPSSQLNASGGSNGSSGGNLIMYGESHPSLTNNIKFRQGSTDILRWNAGNSQWDFQGYGISGVGDITLSGMGIKAALSTGLVVLSGGTSSSLGGNVALYSQGHSTLADNILFRSSDGTKLRWSQADNFWTFGAKDIVGVGHLSLASDRSVNISGTQNAFVGIKPATDINLMLGTGSGSEPRIYFYGAGNGQPTAGNVFIGTANNTGEVDISGTLDMQGNGVRNAASLLRANATSAINISGGSTEALGANLVLYGENHSVAANDISFRSGSSTRLSWDNSLNRWSFVGNDVIDIAALHRSVDNSSVTIAGGNGTTSGGRLVLYGQSNSTNGNDILFTVGTGTPVLHWDDSASAWDYKTGTISGVYALTRGSTTGLTYLAGGSILNRGGNIVLWAESHSTNANDILFRSGDTELLRWDDDANYWNFSAKQITGADLITRGSVSGFLEVSGGNATSGSGANVLLHGPSYPSFANDIQFRTGTTIRLGWDDSQASWDFKGFDVIGLRDITLNNGNILRNHDGNFLTLYGGNATNAGGSVRLYGSTHASNADEVHFRSGAANILAYSASTAVWDMEGRLDVSRISGLISVCQGNTTSQMTLSAGSSPTTGGNLVMFGQGHVSTPNDVLFRTGTTVVAHWDHSKGYWNYTGNPLTGVTAVTRGNNAVQLQLSGGTNADLGGNIVFYGEAHPSAAGDILIRTDTSALLRWDANEAYWTFADNPVTSTPLITRGSTTGFLELGGGGASSGSGANILLHGPSHATTPYDMVFRSGTGVQAQYHHGNSNWDFALNSISTTGNTSASTAAFQAKGNDNAYVLQTFNASASNDAQFHIRHNLGHTVLGNPRGNIRFETRAEFGGMVSRGSPDELTIAAGEVTVFKGFHALDTEAEAGTDELDTINGGQDGDELTLVAEDEARSVVVRHNIGNLRLDGSTDFTLDSINDTITLIKRGANWLEKSRSKNS